ncbi:response regulator transcription factor [Saccharothrix syringae]|uniref:response regulator transcription factor n=1 Tax=Saccharothrix syringae TaxID=103733 RepID=UPI000AAB25CA|nr:LuxR C-terminal-related transcriptional regulator [Saccharothrix syringae]
MAAVEARRRQVVGQLLARNPRTTALGRLSPRERDVLALMAEGLGNTAIAERLVITEGGVHKHIRSIFAKLDLAPDDRADRRVTAVLRYLEGTGARWGRRTRGRSADFTAGPPGTPIPVRARSGECSHRSAIRAGGRRRGR